MTPIQKFNSVLSSANSWKFCNVILSRAGEGVETEAWARDVISLSLRCGAAPTEYRNQILAGCFTALYSLGEFRTSSVHIKTIAVCWSLFQDCVPNHHEVWSYDPTRNGEYGNSESLFDLLRDRDFMASHMILDEDSSTYFTEEI